MILLLPPPLPVWPLGWAVWVHCGNSDSRHTNHRGWTDNSAVVQPHTPCCRPRLQSLHVNRFHRDIRSFDTHVLIGWSLSVCQMHRQGAPSGYWQINDSWVESLPRGDTTHWTLWYVCNKDFTHAAASLQISWIKRSTFRPFWRLPENSNKVQNGGGNHRVPHVLYDPRYLAHEPEYITIQQFCDNHYIARHRICLTMKTKFPWKN